MFEAWPHRARHARGLPQAGRESIAGSSTPAALAVPSQTARRHRSRRSSCSAGRARARARSRIACSASTQGELTASNFRRTFTAGPVALAERMRRGVPARLARAAARGRIAELPARGDRRAASRRRRNQRRRLAELGIVILVDTPDVDGDQPAASQFRRPLHSAGRTCRAVCRVAREIPDDRAGAVLQARDSATAVPCVCS